MAFTFGIYPGALLGDDTGAVTPVRPDDPEQIVTALRTLQGPAPRLLVRAYRPYAQTTPPDTPPTPARPGRYAGEGRALDLVLTFREPTGTVDGWLDFVRETVRGEGHRIGTLQLCEEPNAALPVLDGSIPGVLTALVEGVVAAKAEARVLGYPIEVGFNAIPSFDPADTFWERLGAAATPEFHAALDYAGLDFFPDVFRPIPAGQLGAAVTGVLTAMRNDWLPRAGIGAGVPIRICEHGWPTGPDRPEERQSEVVEEVVRTIAGLRETLGVSGYSFFALRDADSTGTGLFHRFGLLRDDYTPKPAFETYAKLIAELSS
ncbi:hypothetical protein [Longispora albida]|uniref:hypothetical protein n=1 Tax=Longispora albida TaxID=203523 RepID=UPI00038268D3|nr:hypothetical protein [Longispora albida]